MHSPVQSEGTSVKVFIGNLQTKHISTYRDLEGFSGLHFRAGSPHAKSCRSIQLPPHSSLVPFKKPCSVDLSAVPENPSICPILYLTSFASFSLLNSWIFIQYLMPRKPQKSWCCGLWSLTLVHCFSFQTLVLHGGHTDWSQKVLRKLQLN